MKLAQDMQMTVITKVYAGIFWADESMGLCKAVNFAGVFIFRFYRKTITNIGGFKY
jgi:hypothetical protein